MKSDWQSRLREVVDADERSMRKLSTDAGLGVNYIEQTFNRGSAPTQDKLAKVLDQLGEEAAIYVYTGVRLDADTLEFVKAFGDVPEQVRKSAIDLMKNLAAAHKPKREETLKLVADLSDQEISKE